MDRTRFNHDRAALSSPRRGFTLTELLVVIVIMLILVAMTASVVNFTMSAERIRSGARQVQSYLEGARDRAIYSKRAVGVRFLRDQTDPRTCTSMIFIGNSGEAYSVGSIRVARLDSDLNGYDSGDPIQVICGYPHPDITPNSSYIHTNWHRLLQKGLLTDGSQIALFNSSGEIAGSPFTIDLVNSTLTPTKQELILVSPMSDPGGTLPDQFPYPVGLGPNEYDIALPPTILPNQEPMLLPRGIVIDLDASRVPSNWRSGGGYSEYMDLMFSPRGYVAGSAAATGIIHLYVAEAQDVIFASALSGRPVNGNNPPIVPAATVTVGGQPQNIGDRVLVSVFTQTGNISCHPVNPTDGNNNGIADDPYAYAELGEIAGQ